MAHRSVDPPDVFDSRQYGFSQAVVAEGRRHIHLSGQVAADRDEGPAEPTLAGQLEHAFDNVERVLAAADATLEDVTMLRIYLTVGTDADLEVVSEALRRWFPADPPATSWLVVSGLARADWLVELEAEAIV